MTRDGFFSGPRELSISQIAALALSEDERASGLPAPRRLITLSESLITSATSPNAKLSGWIPGASRFSGPDLAAE